MVPTKTKLQQPLLLPVMQVEIYKARNYRESDVTGRYVRPRGKIFRVFECATCYTDRSQFYGQRGMGYTLREYETLGHEIPEAVRAEALAKQTAIRWD